VTDTTLEELTLAVDKALPDLLDEYFAAGENWQPHDYVAWDDGRNYAFLGGTDFTDADIAVTPEVGAGLVLGLLTKDHLPSYHRLLAQHHTINSDWGKFVGHWTAEENRHAIALRDQAVVHRTSDVEQLEAWRLAAVTRGYRQYEASRDELQVAEQIAMVIFHEALSADFFRRLADLAEGSAGTPAGLVQTLRNIARDDEIQQAAWSKVLGAALDANEGRTKEALLSEARKASAIGADTVEGLDDLRELVRAAGVSTPERDLEVVSGVLAQYDLAL
jgi:hypothetical protein